MIFANAKCLFVTLLLSRLLWAASGVPFEVSGTQDPQGLPQLKQQAVMQLLQRYLGNRFDAYESQITPDFAEKYILDYKVSRAPGKMILSGHLDGEALRGWVRLSETKRGSNVVKPVFLLSSTLSGLTITPNQTGAKIREGGMAAIFLAEANQSFQKLNTKLGTVEGGNPGAVRPPSQESELKTLKDFAQGAGYNAALWAHLVPCRSCGGTRLDLHVYHLATQRQVLARSEELALSASDFTNATKLRNALKTPFSNLKTDLENAISDGSLFNFSYRLTIEGLESYRSFKQVELELAQLDYISQSVLKRAQPQVAEYEVLSSLPIEELSSRLSAETFNGFGLKPVRVDSRELTVRYSR